MFHVEHSGGVLSGEHMEASTQRHEANPYGHDFAISLQPTRKEKELMTYGRLALLAAYLGASSLLVSILAPLAGYPLCGACIVIGLGCPALLLVFVVLIGTTIQQGKARK